MDEHGILSFITSCLVCNKKDDLSRCAACKVVFYCSRDHQAANRPIHEWSCTAIEKTQTHLDAEEARLRAHLGNS